MATRRERVILDLEDNLSAGLAKAAVASRLLKGELDSLGRDSTRAGRSLDKSGTDIDRFSGRLKVLRDVAILLGPALVPLGAATIPLLTGSLAALGSAAGGIGVSVLALKGVGDALKVLDDYQLEPTAENLQAVRIEMEKLGPAGEHFARFIDGIEGELRTLQLAARNGLLPGLEEGITSALERLPGVRKVVRELAQGMGELAATAGDDLAPGGDWDNFFRYLDTDGKDTLVSFGGAIGDITNGLANMLVAFAPATRDFTNGFEDMARSFEEWTAGLSESREFQEFLDYVRQSGPQAIDMLGSLAHTLADIAEAAAPVGAVTLPILTRFLDLLGVLASSPLGTPFVAALVGVTAYSRAVDVATGAQKRFNAASKTGFAAAGTVAMVAAFVVTIAEYAELMTEAEDKTRMWDAALADGTLTVDALKADMQALKDDNTISSVGDLLKAAFDPGAWVKSSFIGARLWQREVNQMKGEALLAAQQIEILGAQTKNTGDLADIFGRDIGLTAAQLRVAAHGAEDFSRALSDLNGWLDKRAALRGYRENIQQLAKGLKDGFNRQDREQIDATASSIAQVAAQIKDKGLRADFLANARASLVAMAEKATPKARAEIQKVIDKLDELGLTHPEPTVDANTKPAKQKLAEVRREFDIFDALSGSAELDANAGGFYGVFNPAVSALNSFDGRVATATLILKRGYADAGAGGRGPAAINNERSSGRAGSRGRMADDFSMPALGRGGSGGYDPVAAANKAEMFSEVLRGWAANTNAVSGSLKDLRKRLNEAERAVERETRQRDRLVARRNEMRSAIASDMQGDLFGVSEGSGNVWAEGATPGGVMDPQAAVEARRDRAKRWVAALRTLKGKGVRPVAMQAIISEGLEAAEFMAAQSAAYIGEFTSTLAEAAQFTAQAQNMGANAVVSNAELNAANAELKEANKRLRAIEKAIERADKNNKDGHKGTKDATHGWQQRVRDGHRRGKAYAG